MIGRTRTRRDERGVSLILVLVTLTIFGLIVPVLGQFGSTNGVSGYVLKGQRFDRYAAEAGMQAAIGWTQGQRQAGRAGTFCPDFSAGGLNSALGPNATRSVTVKCAGFDGNGLPVPTASMPAYALMARSTDGQAIHIKGGGSARTAGAWWSEGGIKVDSASIDATADYVGASGPCVGISASPLDCGKKQSVADPDYQVAAQDPILVDRPGHRCDGVRDGELHLAPGLHWDSAMLDWVGDGHCGNVTIVLDSGGPHIFDFQFFASSSTTKRSDWKLVPADGNARVRVVSDAFDGECARSSSPVLFAGTFTMQLGSGATADLCGTDSPGQRRALAQVTNGTDLIPPTETSPVQTPSRWKEDHDGSFDFPESPATPPGLLAGIDCVPNRNCSGGFVSGTLSGDRAEGDVVMTVPDPVPVDGAKVASLHLDITHRERGNDVAESHVWISDGLPGTHQVQCDLTDPSNSLPTADDFRTTGYDCDTSRVELPYFSAGDLTVKYQVQLKNGREGEPEPTADVALDAVQLTAVFARPSARTSKPSGDVLQVDSGGAIHALGTVYLPNGDVSLDFGGSTTSNFGRGLVVKSIDVSGLPSVADFKPFSLPFGGNYTDRLTTFEAFLSGETTPLLTARVRFCDPHPDDALVTDIKAPCAGKAADPKILAWDPTR